MKQLRVGFLSLLVLLYGVPWTTTAQSAPESFTLPRGVAGELYRANIEAVLRETYHLRLETDAGRSIFHWATMSGEIPPGLVMRPNGTIVGIPRAPRDEAYSFQLKVLDVALPRGEALILNFTILISGPRIRLAHISTPRLVSSIGADATKEDTGGPPSGADRLNTSEVETEPKTALVQPAQSMTAQAVYASMMRRDVENGTVASPTSTDSTTNVGVGVSGSPNGSFPMPVPNPSPTPKPTLIINNSTETALGDKIRGPARIEIQNLNVLRYDIKVGKEVSFPPGPDLKVPFIPLPTEQTAKENKNAGGAAPTPSPSPANKTRMESLVTQTMPPQCDSITECFNGLLGRLNGLEEEKAAQVGKIDTAIGKMNGVKADLESLVSASDSVLMSGGGPPALIARLTPLIGSGDTKGKIDEALAERWPDTEIESLIGAFNILKNDLVGLPTVPIKSSDKFDDWYKNGNKAAYDSAKARIDELLTQLNGLKSSGTQGTAFQNAQNKLRLWKPILHSVQHGGPEGFNHTVKADCRFAFDSNKETKYKLSKRDRLADAGAAPSNEDLVTVVCSSPFSISAGFGFSTIGEKDFVFVPSTKTVTANGQTTTTVINRFGFRNKSGYRPMPVLLLNTRVWEPNDTIALHISTGAVVDAKTGQAGTDVEYIVGPSISFRRAFFITPGLHIGRVPKLAGGFTLDQEVPTGISEPPLEKAWKKAFVTTFTYKIK